ncbi:hypothetical protein B296_00043420, partial [Ensete ventricosum]
MRFPLHPVIEVCLEGWQISPSQMMPNSWRYLVVGAPQPSGRLGWWTTQSRHFRPMRPNWSSGQWVGGSIDDVGASLKKRSKKATPEEPVDASGGTTKVPIGKGREPTSKGKEPVEVEEVHRGFMRGGGLGRGGQ